MPEQTAVSFTWEIFVKPVIVFLLGFLGWNLKNARKEINDFHKDYVGKEDYKSDMKELKEFMKDDRKERNELAKEDRKIFRDGIKRIHDRVDEIAKKS